MKNTFPSSCYSFIVSMVMFIAEYVCIVSMETAQPLYSDPHLRRAVGFFGPVGLFKHGPKLAALLLRKKRLSK